MVAIPRLGALTPASVARLAQYAAGQTFWLRPMSFNRAMRQHGELFRAIVNSTLVRAT